LNAVVSSLGLMYYNRDGHKKLVIKMQYSGANHVLFPYLFASLKA